MEDVFEGTCVVLLHGGDPQLLALVPEAAVLAFSADGVVNPIHCIPAIASPAAPWAFIVLTHRPHLELHCTEKEQASFPPATAVADMQDFGKPPWLEPTSN